MQKAREDYNVIAQQLPYKILHCKTQPTFPWISPSVVQASGHTPNNKITFNQENNLNN